MVYSRRNSKRVKFYLHGRITNKKTGEGTYYFSPRKGKNTLSKLPSGYKVKELKSGLLYVVRKC